MSPPPSTCTPWAACCSRCSSARRRSTATLQYEILNKHIRQQPTPVSMLRGEVPAGLEAVVARLLEKDPANRPGTAAEVAELLLPFAQQAEPGVIGAPGDPVLALLREQEAASGRDEEDTGSVGEAPPRPAPEPKPASAAGFDIFAVHQRLIREYRDYTEGAAVIRNDRIAKFFDADLDAKSQWPDPWLSLNPFFADGGSVADLVAEGWLHPECANIFQTGKSDTATTCDGRPIRFYRHQRDAIRAAARRRQLRAHHRHRLRQVAVLHRPDRGPGAARPRRPATGRRGSGRSSSTR